jgi:hypothetical protein
MTRAQLAHVLRAAANDTRESRILVIGSQAILGSFDEAALPTVATRSIEADLVFYKSANPSELADQVDGAIGELSPFHDLNNYYAQGVDLTTPVLPSGWERRVVEWAVIDAHQAPHGSQSLAVLVGECRAASVSLSSRRRTPV